MVRNIQKKSRYKIGKEAEKLALSCLKGLYPRSSITSGNRGQACDYLIRTNNAIQKVEVKSCSNNGRFMIHDYQFEALRNISKQSNLENQWVFVWFKGSQKLIQLVKFSKLKELLSNVPLRKCMTGYSKFMDMNENEYKKNKHLAVKRFTIKENLKEEKIYKVKFRRYGFLYNISPKSIFVA